MFFITDSLDVFLGAQVIPVGLVKNGMSKVMIGWPGSSVG